VLFGGGLIERGGLRAELHVDSFALDLVGPFEVRVVTLGGIPVGKRSSDGRISSCVSRRSLSGNTPVGGVLGAPGGSVGRGGRGGPAGMPCVRACIQVLTNSILRCLYSMNTQIPKTFLLRHFSNEKRACGRVIRMACSRRLVELPRRGEFLGSGVVKLRLASRRGQAGRDSPNLPITQFVGCYPMVATII
jgi:hypothetical protein